MKTVFETCIPRREVLEGELRDQQFAAKLRAVLDGTADEVYQDGKKFFENTFITEGLRTLAREVLGRLSGAQPSNSPFIRLETAFGGGKTHNLIALYHLSQGQREAVPVDLVDPAWIPTEPWLAAGVVGTDMESADGIQHDDGITTRTLWGELAWQIGRARGDAAGAYEIVRQSDELGTAIGTAALERLIGDEPTIIMLDEVARYLTVAKAIPTAHGGSNLAEQSVAFLMSLIEFAASKPRVAVVLTLADSSDAFGEASDQLRQELEEAKRVSARQERVITPTGETEIARIVCHRLFEHIDPDAARQTAEAFSAYYRKLGEQAADLPQRALRADYAEEIQQSYPFHPELLRTLSLKTSTIPTFHKTRGALRLLARTVRQLWSTKPADAWVIATHHLDLSVEEIKDDLTSRLNRPAFRQVIEADISGGHGATSHCQEIDRRFVEVGRPPYAQRTATSILLHSLTQGVATGVDPAELLLSVLQPGDDPQLVRRAIALMLGEEKGEPGTACWYLHWDGHRYRFSTEPSLEKIVQEEIGLVGRIAAKQELDRRIKNIWKKGALVPVYFPDEAVDLEDDANEPKLAIIHYDAATTTADAVEPPEVVAKLFAETGSANAFRVYKNNVVFLVADKDQTERMVNVVRRYLAISRIASDSGRMAEFTEENRKKLRGMLEGAELDVRVAITRAYRHLLYPSADGLKRGEGLAHDVLPAQEQGEVKQDQTAVVLKILKQLDKVLTADDPPLPPPYVRSKAWPHNAERISTEDLRREFAKRVGLRMLLDINQLKKTIRAGIEQGTWIYFDSVEQIGYGQVSPMPHIQISEDAFLYTPEAAKQHGIQIKGEEKPAPVEVCPICGQAECICGTQRAPGVETPLTRQLLRVRETGLPAQALQAVADHFHDAKAGPLARLVIELDGIGTEAANDLKKLGLAIPQFGKGTVQVSLELQAELGAERTDESLSIRFAGGWERYKRVKQLAESFAQEATKAHVRVRVSINYAGGLEIRDPAFETVRDVLTTLGIGKIAIEAEELPTVAAEGA